MTHKVAKVNKVSDPLIIKVKDSKEKNWEAKKSVPSSSSDKKNELILESRWFRRLTK